MPLDPSFAVQSAVFSTLTTDAGVVAQVGTRTYDRVPQNPTFPFIHIGDDQVIGDTYQGSATSTVHVSVHVFSRWQGKKELKSVAAAVRTALEGYLPLTGFVTVTYEYKTTRYLTDPDGLTEHAVIEFMYDVAAVE